MFCSNCHEEMTSVSVDNQRVLHCKNCGASFFEENGINRIREHSAQQLAFDKRGNFIFDKEKACPKDGVPLALVANDEAVPNTAHLFRCMACKGIFVHADDLLIFKKAQSAKIEYFKAWNMPLPSVRAVLVAVFVGVISLSAFTTYTLQQGSTTTQAQDVVRNIHVSTSGRYLFVSFKTDQPHTSAIIFTNKKTGEKTTKTISINGSTLHYITLTDVELSESMYYQILVTDRNGKQLVTDEQKLIVEP